MNVKMEYRRVALVAIQDNGRAYLLPEEGEWVEGVASHNENFLQVTYGGIETFETEDDVE